MATRLNSASAGEICKDCGLCCDGSIFSEVELADARESATLEAMGLSVEDEDGDEPAVLIQPCGALRGTRCSIYSHRPECCRTFECVLLKKVIAGKCSPDEARAKIRQLQTGLDKFESLIQPD